MAAAVDHLATLDDVDTARVVTLGHSAGGQLAVWVAGRSRDLGGPVRVRVTAAVPQAGVLDLAGTAASRLGGSAVPDLVGGTPARVPERYAEVDPLAGVPLDVPVRCVHSPDDTSVPFRQSRMYVDAARAAGGDAALVAVPGDHFALIDPTTSAWRATLDVLTPLLRTD